MIISTTKLYQLLSEKIDKDAAEALTSYVEEKVGKEVKEQTTHLATKEDIYALREEIAKKYADTIKWLFVFWVGTIGTMIAIVKLL